MEELVLKIESIANAAANTIASPNWADILSVILSLLAVIVAGCVAWKQIDIAKGQNKISLMQAQIADKQNQIALFEKRFEIYNLLLLCITSAEVIKSVDKNEDILQYLYVLFAEKPEAKDDFNPHKARTYLTNCSMKLQQAGFLFSKEVVPYIDKVSVALLVLANAYVEDDGQERFNEKKHEYFMAIKHFEDNEGFKHIRREMNMI